MSSDNLIVVSNDGHAGPRLVKDLRPYCEKKYLEQFDEYVANTNSATLDGFEAQGVRGFNPTRGQVTGGKDDEPLFGSSTEINAASVERTVLNLQTAGHYDPYARLHDMDWDGVTAEVIFHASMNFERMPFMPFGSDTVIEFANLDFELIHAGYRIYNRWLADHVSVAPDRLIGLIYIPTWDVDLAIKEIEWGASVGLRGVNLPAPRKGIREYDDEYWEPFWSACESVNLTLNTHAGVPFFPMSGPQSFALSRVEIGSWPSRRGMFRLIFGGVFERHPSLNYILTECARGWWPYTARDLDLAWGNPTPALRAQVPKKPSEYMKSNVFVGASFMPPSEVEEALTEEYWTNVVWGRYYPHGEGTYKYPSYEGEPSSTKRYLQWTFANCPLEKARAMLGENGIRAYHLDRGKLAEIAAQIGPSPELIATPLEELPTGGFGDVYDVYTQTGTTSMTGITAEAMK